MQIISVDFYGNFGFFKKPDINDSIYLTYNMLHKPALLGIFGAILGFEGHKKYGKLPEYYEKLNELKIGIQPIGKGQKNGNFVKTTVKYNNATGLASAGTLNILEQILVNPAFRVFVELEENSDLFEKLENKKATFIPYFGKNDFPCWWKHFKVYENVCDVQSETFKISTIFKKQSDKTLKELKKQVAFGLLAGMKQKAEASFSQFERLPVSFNETLMQYSDQEEFVYTNLTFDKNKFLPNSDFKQLEDGDVIYLF